MNTSPPDRYFYHSFPRRAGSDEMKKGLSILKSIVKSGLLLTPEQSIRNAVGTMENYPETGEFHGTCPL